MQSTVDAGLDSLPIGEGSALTGPDAIVLVGGYIKQLYDGYKKIDSLLHGKDVDLARAINDAKDSILNQMNGLVAKKLIDDVEASIRNWAEVSATLRAYPTGNSGVMLDRVPELLNLTQHTWVSLRNAIGSTSSHDVAYRLAPAFNVIASLRITILKDLRQLNPPMVVAQDAIDVVLADTMTTNYSMVGASVVAHSGPATSLDSRAHLHAKNTVRGKKLYNRFYVGTVFGCPVTCEFHVGSYDGTYTCFRQEGFSRFARVVDGGIDFKCTNMFGEHPNGCRGWSKQSQPPLPSVPSLEFWRVFPGPTCTQSLDAAVAERMMFDPTVNLIKQALQGLVSNAQAGESWTFKPQLYTVYDNEYLPGKPGYLFKNNDI